MTLMTKEWLDHIDRLISQRPYSREILKAYRELVLLMGETEPTPPAVKLDKNLQSIKQKERFPLFQRTELPVDLEASRRLLELFFNHLSDSDRPDREAIRKALDHVREHPEAARKLLVSFLMEDLTDTARFCESTGLDPKTAEFLAMNALKPSLSSCSETYSQYLDLQHWEEGYCPLCGSKPGMSVIEQSGKRGLHCSLCGTRWNYPRMKCPFCSEKEYTRLGYFQDERLESLRVDYCLSCKRYVKSVDLRSMEAPAPMELENLSTIHLDILAVEQGFG